MLGNKHYRAIKLFFITLAACCTMSCAHLASNKAACENADFLLPLPYSFLGSIFQISPCTSIEPLRIEIGVELARFRSGVVQAIKNKERTYDFDNFALKMGCNSTVTNKLLSLLIENEAIVFGKNSEKSNREVVRKVRELTLKDPELLKNCWQ